MKDFISGLTYVSAGLKLILRPGIRMYVLIPLLLNTLLFTAAIFYGADKLGELIDMIIGQWAWLEWIRWLLWPVFLLLCLMIFFFCFSIMANLVCSPFNGFLAEAVERHVTGHGPENNGGLARIPVEMLHAVKMEGLKFLYFLSRALPLLLLFFIPLIQAAAPLLWLLFGAWMLALEYLDFPMSNNQIDFAETRQRLAGKRGLAIGFGTGIMIMTMIPVVNFISIPVAVCGATRLWLDRIKSGNSQAA